MRTIAETIPIAWAVFDREMRYILASKRWLDDYGLPDRDITGLVHYEVFPSPSQAWREIHERCLAGICESGAETPFDRNGEVRYLDWSVVPWRDNHGGIGGIIVSTQDVTERVESRAEKERLHRERMEALEQSDRLKDEFLSVISHELRTPLNFIMGFASILEDGVAGPLNSEQQEYPRKILGGRDDPDRARTDILRFGCLGSLLFPASSYVALTAERLTDRESAPESVGAPGR